MIRDLEIFFADGNKLSYVPVDFGTLKRLRQIDLSSNKFSIFPLPICNLKTVESLKLSKNEIESIPAEIANLDRLSSLHLNNNKIHTFAPELCSLIQLHILDFSNNYVEDIPDAISQMENLTDLDLSHNRFLEFPKTVVGIPRLERLKFDQAEGHPVPGLPDEIEFSNVSYLIVSNNTLRTLPSTMSGMKNIISIIADHNEIGELPDSFCRLRRLQVLHLNDNKLSSLPENFDHLRNLKDLRLHNNPLRTPPMDVCVSGVVQPIGRFIRRALEREDILMAKMFDVIKTSLTKQELRYLLKKFRFPDEKISELDQTYHGKDKLPERIYHAMVFWREFKGPLATIDELLRVFHLIGYDALCQKLKAMKIYAQRPRF